MKRLIYQVYVGKRSKLYDHCVKSVQDYCDKYGIDYHIQTQPKLRITPDVFSTNRSPESYGRLGYLPIYEKENAFEYLDKYDQVAIIDSDVYIRPDAPNVFDTINKDVDFAGVLEKEMPCTDEYFRKIMNYSRMQYSQPKALHNLFDWGKNGCADFYNMGIMILNKSITRFIFPDSPLSFIRRPQFKPFVDGLGAWKWSTDQTLLNFWVKKTDMKVQNLSYEWNGLYSAIPKDKIKQAHFVHFFLKDKLPERGENVPELMKNV